MNKTNAHLYLPFVQAMAEGKTVQIRSSLSLGCTDYRDMTEATFSGSPEYYRVKPEPEEVWVNKWKDGAHFYHKTKAGAIKGAQTPSDYEFIAKKFVEAPEN